MEAQVLFSDLSYDTYDPGVTLPARFSRLIDKLDMAKTVKDKWTAVKMHMGRGIGYSTIPPLFVKILVDKLKGYGAKVFITDQDVSGADSRGYTESYFGVPVVYACGVMGKYFYEKAVDFKTFKNLDIAGNIHDAEVMIDLSHVKGHGACGYGGACKNIAMGCVTDRTRQQIHNLEGGLKWDKDLCTHCELCVTNCNHHANRFNSANEYEIFFHHCTFCQHCLKTCPAGAITLDKDSFEDFQTGMALSTEEVLKTFKKDRVFYINILLNITPLCDCWGFTNPALVPDIGIMASRDLVAIERASLDTIKIENLITSALPQGAELKETGHLFERLHGKNPFIQLNELEKRNLGTQKYVIEKIQ